VRAEARRRIGELDAPYCVLSIPLLVETGQADTVDRVLVVDCPESLQRARVAARNRWTGEEIDAMIAAQATCAQRLEAADDILVNDGDPAALTRAIEALHRHYLALSSARDTPADDSSSPAH
jgi:dephospho-CoA kinase